MRRKPQSFLITILRDETDPDVICGRIRTITTDEECHFRGVTELTKILYEKSERQNQERQNDPTTRAKS